MSHLASLRLLSPARSLRTSLAPALSAPTRVSAASRPCGPISTRRHASNQIGEPPRTQKPFSWAALAIFLATGTGLYFYFDAEKKRMLQKRAEEAANQKVGRPDIGGPFQLDGLDGKPFTHNDLLGRFTMLYFGFTNCPDICPEELDKMGQVVDAISAKYGKDSLVPVFVTVDPARDTAPAMKKYLKDFHPSMIGLRGDYDAIKRMCKTYRVYFSTPPNKKPGDDYLVDHSIFFYLMSPEGRFVEAFGKIFTKEQVIEKVSEFMESHRAGVRWGEPVQSVVEPSPRA